VQFTAGADWKNSETRGQRCVCEDEQKALDAAAYDVGVRKTITDVMNLFVCFDYANKLMGQPTSRKKATPPN